MTSVNDARCQVEAQWKYDCVLVGALCIPGREADQGSQSLRDDCFQNE